MASIKIFNKIIDDIDTNKTILEILLANNVYINNPCNGKGTCGKCRIRIVTGDVSILTNTERKFLTDKEIEDGIRLACMTKAIGNIEIEVLEKEKKTEVLVDSFIRAFDKNDLQSGFGIAIDIGTTTVVAELVDLNNGFKHSNATMINPQKKYGLDVLTRITYEIENGDLAIRDLQGAIIDGINNLIFELCNDTNIDILDIKKICVSANCVMMHMFLGIDARSIGTYPYKPQILESKELSAKGLGLDVAEDCRCICLPHVSSFIGSDIVSGIYTCDIKNIDGNVLFIDIGTNAEIVLKANGKLVSCSCAAGPALEGMNISKGMRAENGAIEDVIISDKECIIKIIGETKPEGLCGSGILAVIKELLRNNVVKKNGAIVNPENASISANLLKNIRVNNKKKEYVICRDEEISISQSDIRQVQLAKAAILSGFISLLKECNIDILKLDKILIAGQFGAHLPATSITGIGILPKEVENRIEYVGNVSKTGAYITLLSKNALSEMNKLSKEVNYIELADTDDYENIFVKSMEFPSDQ